MKLKKIKEGALLPDGEFLVEIEDAQCMETLSHQPYINLRARVIGSPYAGRQLFADISLLSGNNTVLMIVTRCMEAFGVDVQEWQSELENTGTLVDVAGRLVGRRVIFVVGQQEYPKGDEPKTYRNCVLRIEAND